MGQPVGVRVPPSAFETPKATDNEGVISGLWCFAERE